MEMVADVLVVHLFGRISTAFDFDVVGGGGGRRRRSTVNIIVIVSLIDIVGGRFRNNGGKLWKVAGRKRAINSLGSDTNN
jgi:hypothetical protein